MEHLSLQFRCKILRTTEDGFIALEKEYLIRFQDKKNKHLFKPSDEILVVIENVEEARTEEIRGGYSVIYCILKNYLSNGIQFVDTGGVVSKGLFWNYRGVLTNQFFEDNDLWQKDSVLRVMLHKV